MLLLFVRNLRSVALANSAIPEKRQQASGDIFAFQRPRCCLMYLSCESLLPLKKEKPSVNSSRCLSMYVCDIRALAVECPRASNY